MGRGGMRYGAGRPGWHIKAEHCLRLDVRQLHQRGLLAPSCSYSWHWRNSRTGEETGSISVHCTGDTLRLTYAQDGVPQSITISIDRTPCTFGGWRKWFRCLQCNSRCAVLYLRSGWWRCRQCSSVVYASQSEDAIDRAWRRQHRIEARLGPDGSRPGRMHHATYGRLRAAVRACEMQRDEQIALAIARLGLLDW